MTSRDPGKQDFADKELSQLYQSLEAPNVSAKTDEAILSFARQRNVLPPETAKPKINWKGGYAVAASVVLVSMLSLTQMKPAQISPSSDSASGVEVASISEPMTLNAADSSQIDAQPKNIERSSMPKIPSFEVLEETSEQLIAPASRQPQNQTTAATKSTTSSVLPECKLSLHGTYKLESTPLGKFVLGWSDKNKQWLITQLNGKKSYAQMRSTVPGEDIAILNKTGFSDAYKFTQSALETCRVQFGDPEY